MTQRTITRVFPNIGYSGRTPNGVSEGLTRAMRSNVPGTEFSHDAIFDGQVSRAAAWFRKQYDSDMQDNTADVWETAPLGRYNDSAGQWRWPTRSEWDGPIMQGFRAFVDMLRFRSDRPNHQVRASFGCPRKRLIGSDRRDIKRLPSCAGQFDDVSKNAPYLTNWLTKAGRRGDVLETALTDTPTEPRRATRFVTFPGMEHVVQRVRAGIVSHWVERWDTIGGSPLSFTFHDGRGMFVAWNNPDFPALSLYLPAADRETMSVDTLRRVLPLFIDCSIQGAIPESHLQVVREWRGRSMSSNVGPSARPESLT